MTYIPENSNLNPSFAPNPQQPDHMLVDFLDLKSQHQAQERLHLIQQNAVSKDPFAKPFPPKKIIARIEPLHSGEKYHKVETIKQNIIVENKPEICSTLHPYLRYNTVTKRYVAPGQKPLAGYPKDGGYESSVPVAKRQKTWSPTSITDDPSHAIEQDIAVFTPVKTFTLDPHSPYISTPDGQIIPHYLSDERGNIQVQIKDVWTVIDKDDLEKCHKLASITPAEQRKEICASKTRILSKKLTPQSMQQDYVSRELSEKMQHSQEKIHELQKSLKKLEITRKCLESFSIAAGLSMSILTFCPVPFFAMAIAGGLAFLGLIAKGLVGLQIKKKILLCQNRQAKFASYQKALADVLMKQAVKKGSPNVEALKLATKHKVKKAEPRLSLHALDLQRL